MKTYKNLYAEICAWNNICLAWRKARKHKTKMDYVIEFDKNIRENLQQLRKELIGQTYSPEPLETFILRDPKTRKISKSEFRDRIVHHALVRIIEPIFDKSFIQDSCANRLGKGNLFALKRFNAFKNKVTLNNTQEGYVLKADIKHYFAEIDREILIKILERKIKDNKAMWLIKKILDNYSVDSAGGRTSFCQENSRPDFEKSSGSLLKSNRSGMPLGNLTSQFFANVYLNELDYFVKCRLRAKFYLRYVDDFVILHENKKQLEAWKKQIDEFLMRELKIELHPDKSRIIPLSKGIDFVGFRNFYHFRLLRKRNIRNMKTKIAMFKAGLLFSKNLEESFQGWNAYAKWANTFKLRKDIIGDLTRAHLMHQ